MNILLKQNRGIGDLMFGYAFYQALISKFAEANIYWDVPEDYASLLEYFKLKRVSDNEDNSTMCHSHVAEGVRSLNENPVSTGMYVVLDPQVKPEEDIGDYDLIIDLNKNIRTRNFTLHEVERYFLAHKNLNLDISKAIYPQRKSKPDKNKLILSLGARIPTRRWTVKNYIALLNSLKQYNIVLLGGNDVLDDAKEICLACNKVINKTGTLNLAQTCEEIATASYVIAMDSGVAHLCATIGIPVLVLTFNKVQNNFRWSPWTENCLVIRGDHNCKRICHSSECLENDCREALSIPKVQVAFTALLAGKRNGKNKLELAKNSLFMLFTKKDELYNSLKQNGYQVFHYDKKEALNSFIIEHNINVLVNPKINKLKLWFDLLKVSNYVSEYPLVIKSKEIATESFFKDFLSNNL